MPWRCACLVWRESNRYATLFRVLWHALVSQLVEEAASKSAQCGFESHRGHQKVRVIRHHDGAGRIVRSALFRILGIVWPHDVAWTGGTGELTGLRIISLDMLSRLIIGFARNQICGEFICCQQYVKRYSKEVCNISNICWHPISLSVEFSTQGRLLYFQGSGQDLLFGFIESHKQSNIASRNALEFLCGGGLSGFNIVHIRNCIRSDLLYS